MIITSFYTIGTPYEDNIKTLKSSLDKFNLKYVINGISSKGTWKANCVYRAKYLIEMMDKYNDSMLWVDADAEILKYPSLLYDISDDVDLAWYDRNNKEILLGTSYWKNSSEVKQLLLNWYETCNLNSNVISQREFMGLLGRKYNNKFTIQILPESYCHIFDTKDGTGEDPVIIHNQLSRKTRNVIKAPEQTADITVQNMSEYGTNIRVNQYHIDGVVYVATSNNSDNISRKLTELSRSFNTLKYYNQGVKTCLIASNNIIPSANFGFDHIIVSKYVDLDGTISSKLQALELSPFTHSLLLDIDTLILGDISAGFELIRERDMALTIDAEQDNGAFTIFNKGVMFINKNNDTINMFDRMMALHKGMSNSDFRITMSQYVYNDMLNVYPLSYFWNVRSDYMGFHPISHDKRNFYNKIRILHTHLARKDSIDFLNGHPNVDEIKRIMNTTAVVPAPVSVIVPARNMSIYSTPTQGGHQIRSERPMSELPIAPPIMPAPTSVATNTKKTVYLPLGQTGWAFDVRCTNLEKHLSQYYNIKKVSSFDISRKGIGLHADLVYFPTYESIDRLGHHCKRVCATIGGLVIRTLDESISHFGKALAIAVPNNTWYKKYLEKDLDIKFFLIPNGVDVDLFVPRSRKNNPDEFIVGWAGNDRPDRAKVKRIQELREACDKLGIRVLEQKLSESVPHHKMPEFYQQIDLYVNISITEGSNNCILEASSCGVPILGTPVGNMPELISAGAQIVQNDMSDLNYKLTYFRDMTNQQRQEIGNAMRQEMIQNYTSKIAAMRYKEMFDYALSL